jgi:hypothetical protein
MRRLTRTAPLFIAMVAALAFAAPGYGALTAPVGTTTTIGEPVPAFAWSPVTGADHYTFELDSGATLGTPLITISTKNTRATLSQTISDGPYTWRVRAVSSTGTNGPWSSAVNWTKTGTNPTLITPAAGDTITYPSPVLLTWVPVDGAYNYVVSIADASNMANATAVTTEATSYSPGSWLPPGVHYWSVTAKDARGNPVGTSPAGAGSAFTWAWDSSVHNLSIVNAIDISAGVTAQWTMFDPQFTWDPVPGAVKYQVEVNTDNISWSAGSKMCCADTVATTLTPKNLLPNATYAWRVRAIDASGYAGGWAVGGNFSQSFDSFVTAPPSTPSVPNLRMADNLSDPGTDFAPGTAGYQTQVPVVKWDPVPGASGYDLLMVEYTSGQCQWTGPGTQWGVRTAATAFTPLGAGWNGLKPWPNNGTTVSTDGSDLIPGASYCVRVTHLPRPQRRWLGAGIHVRQPAHRRGMLRSVHQRLSGRSRLPGSDHGLHAVGGAPVHVEPGRRCERLLRDRGPRPGVQHDRRLRVHASACLRAARGLVGAHVPEPEHALLLGRAAFDGCQRLGCGDQSAVGSPADIRPAAGRPDAGVARGSRGGQRAADVLVGSDRGRPAV